MTEERNKIYFASDFHLGSGSMPESKERERKIVQWLEKISHDASEVFLVGDVFDYWFEYKETIPKGYSRLFGTIASMADDGVQFHFFTGNHDIWVRNYFEEEFGMKIYTKPQLFERFGKKIFVGHGDGLGPSDHGYKLLKGVLTNPLAKWLFARIHPNTGLAIMRMASKSSRMTGREEGISDMSKEWLVNFCETYISKFEAPDYFVFGHRHIPISHHLSNGKSIYFNLGEWWQSCSYLEGSQEGFVLKFS